MISQRKTKNMKKGSVGEIEKQVFFIIPYKITIAV